LNLKLKLAETKKSDSKSKLGTRSQLYSNINMTKTTESNSVPLHDTSINIKHGYKFIQPKQGKHYANMHTRPNFLKELLEQRTGLGNKISKERDNNNYNSIP
jgi:hypothetical protein